MRYQNWAGTVQVDDLWVCTPRNQADVVAVANWAVTQKYRVRAGGRGHNFSPLTVTSGPSGASRVVVADMTKHFNGMGIVSDQPVAVWVGAGATVGCLLEYLESNGYGVTAAPACGELTVGGVLSVGAHGTSLPAAGERLQPGHTYGSLSNLVVAVTAIVWDNAAGRYVARIFHRAHPDCSAFLVHLGRAFIVEVVLRVGANDNRRCVSEMTTPASRLFAPQGAPSPRSFAGMVERSGRVEAIWFPFTDRTWTKSWTPHAVQPRRSRLASEPYNYPFSDNIPEPIADIVSRLITGKPELAPELGELEYTSTAAGLASSAATDLWGPSKNLLFYVKPTTLRYSTCGYAVLCRRRDIQRVVFEFAAFYRELLERYKEQSRYPMNGPIEIRASGLDRACDVGVAWARPPTLSPLAPDRDHQQFDVAVWLNLLSFPGTPDADDFYREVEQFVFTNYRTPYATARVEWSKGWAYGAAGAWSDATILAAAVPASFGPTWRWATETLNSYDPHRIFTNALLDLLFS